MDFFFHLLWASFHWRTLPMFAFPLALWTQLHRRRSCAVENFTGHIPTLCSQSPIMWRRWLYWMSEPKPGVGGHSCHTRIKTKVSSCLPSTKTTENSTGAYICYVLSTARLIQLHHNIIRLEFCWWVPVSIYTEECFWLDHRQKDQQFCWSYK